MPSIKYLAVCSALFPLIPLLCSGAEVGRKTFHLAIDGRENAVGTHEDPFSSLEQARDAVRAHLQGGGTNEVEVLIRAGTYPFEKTLAFDERDSGREGARVTYKAHPGEKVFFTGGVSIEPEKLEVIGDPKIRERIIEKEAIEHIRQLNLRELGITDYSEFKSRGFRRPYKNPGLELFINGKAMEKARWPNEGFVDIGRIVDKGGVPRYGDFSNRGGTFTYGYDRPKHWLEAEDLFVSGNFSESFADDRLRVAKIDPEKKTMTMAHAHLYGLKSGKVYTNYFAVNLLEEIDQPGEWYLDRKSGIAYVYPPKGGVDTIQVSLLDEPMIALEGVSHVSFEGITFEVMRDMAVYMERGRNNLIAGCTFRNIGLLAVCMGKGAEAPDGEYSYGHHESTTYKPATAVSRELGELDNWLYHDTVFYRDAGYDHGVLSCDIYNLGAGAVHLGGGNRKTLEPGGNFVRNCHIRDFNRLDRSYRAAVNVTGCGNVIAHNLIHDAPDMAIYLHGNDHVIEYNHVHHVMLENNEGGWFYMGRDLSELGNVIRYNFAHHVGVTEDGREGDRTEGSAGIYIDDRGSGVEVYGNVLYKTGRGRGAILYKASDVKVRNNIFIECQHAICARAWEFGIPENIEKTFGPDSLFAQRLFAVDYLKPPYIERYPFIADYLIAEKSWKSRRNVTENNVLVGMDEKQMFLVQNGGDVGLGENFITSGDPGFVDADKLDFRLRKDSVVFRQLPDFKPIPFEKIGLFSDEFRSVR